MFQSSVNAPCGVYAGAGGDDIAGEESVGAEMVGEGRDMIGKHSAMCMYEGREATTASVRMCCDRQLR